MEQDINKRNSFISNFRGTRVFIAKMLVGLAIFAIYINSLLPQYEQGYNASLIDKVKRLESIMEPKIVLIGNSNVAFGIDSKMLEAEMGMPVVNMGLHGGLGNAFHEEMAKLNARPGDIYILCHSDYNDADKIGNTELAWVYLENHFTLWRLLRFSDISAMVKSFPVYLKKSMTLVSSGMGNRKPNSIYSRAAFNEYGDIGTLREKAFYKKNAKAMKAAPHVSDIAINRINTLNQYIMSKGATLLVAGYPIRNGSITKSPYQYIKFQEILSEKLECPVISNYVDYMFDYRYFYNAHLHLNSEGAKLRTIQLISDLKRWLESGSEDVATHNDKCADIISDVNLPHIDDFHEYIDALNNAKNRYTIFISCKDAPSSRLDKELFGKLNLFGLAIDGVGSQNYAAVIDKGIVIEEDMKNEKIVLSGVVDNGEMTYSLLSDGKNKELGSSIQLNGEECSENVNGLNIVVYSNETHRRLDEVGFEFSLSETKAHRCPLKMEP